MNQLYVDRPQTETKHFILRRYLQNLAFKVLQGKHTVLTYVDGFSGPWGAQSSEYSDTSFMIAIEVLKDVQAQLRTRDLIREIRCFFVEKGPAYAQLKAAVMKHHDPDNNFYVHTFHGAFEDAVEPITKVIANSFALTFIDPTGWTGYEFSKIAPVLRHSPGEVLLNFMFDFINRFTASPDPKTIASFDGILGKSWLSKLDPKLSHDEAVRALFSAGFRAAGAFKFVLSTPIEKTKERTHFCIVYGTRHDKGLETYREVEFSAMRDHGLRRMGARHARQEARTGQPDMFIQAGMLPEPPIESQIEAFKVEAREWLLERLRADGRPMLFREVWPAMIDRYMLRRTDAKRVCSELSKQGHIRQSWRDNGSKRHTPEDQDVIALLSPSS